ncbi:hypothetical protein [Nevskia ramosa]|uniref:hypothetical protein n=1 Tax=Nevskia ramosa TaxID=64002 RepID=UPI0003B6464F|nr:hypothetical protein [Nevskia ramosa]
MRTTLHRRALLLICFSLTTLAGGCKEEKKPVEIPPEQLVGLFKNISGCREKYAAMDARIDAAGVRNPAFHRVPGFPYLRTDRLMASYRDQLGTFDEAAGWVRRMREFDQEAREFEYENLGMTSREAAILRFDFLVCSQGLAGLEMEIPSNFELVRESASVPDDYSTKTQLLGLYPLSTPLLRSKINRFEKAVRAEFAQPAEALIGEGPQVLWQVDQIEDLSLVPKHIYDTSPDELGLPGLVDSAWRAVAEAYAPQLAGAADGKAGLLGAPTWTASGLTVDTSKPTVNYQIGFVRFGQMSLIQVDYFLWFNRPASASVAKDAAPIDGLIWRVTLDEFLKPLAYDSLRASGSEHFWFPVQTRLQRQAAVDGQPPFLPQEGLAPENPRLLLASSNGELRRVQSAATPLAKAETRRYQLQRYEDLYRLPLPGGGSRSLFDTAGFVPGTDSEAPGWMLASGIAEPGRLRHLAHLPVDYIGRRHFDDAHLLETVFVPLPAPPIPAQLEVGASAPSAMSAGDAAR